VNTSDEQSENGKPFVRDLWPFPETAEAKARGCLCRIARNRDGSPALGIDGELIYSLTKGCPIPNHH
jgi:hypothetical protein